MLHQNLDHKEDWFEIKPLMIFPAESLQIAAYTEKNSRIAVSKLILKDCCKRRRPELFNKRGRGLPSCYTI
jgi:hypothetical protein